MRTAAHWPIALGAALAACQGETEEPPVAAIQSEIALQPVGTCAALETYIEDTAVQEMRTNLDAWRDGGWWFGPIANGPGRAEDGAAAPSSGSTAPRDYTKTNTQVAGVDEADFMKTDGTRILVLSGRKLYLAKSWPASDLAIASRLDIEGWPLEMFLDEGGKAVVFSAWWPEQQGWAEVYCGPWGCGGHRSYTRVTIVDTTGDRLRVEREMFFPGSYVSSRRVGGSVRVVLREELIGPRDLEWWPQDFQGDPQQDAAAFEVALERVKQRNEARIRALGLAEWLPPAYVRSSGRRVELGLDCASFHRPNAPVRLGLTTVATLDLAPEIPSLRRMSVLGEVGEIYASTDALYLASPHWWWSRRAGQRTHTYLHRLDITSPSVTRYTGSGGVPGYLLDQFSMDEHRGHLRVATTVEELVPDQSWWRVETSNRVAVLALARGRLVEVGAVEGIAPRERITSARFIEDRGYVVTFEQIDPLFTLDLSNPRAPRVVGELKVPGFSTYIHPLDANHLLTIGVHLPDPDANGVVDWSQRAMKLTVFDVTDFARPREKFTQVVGSAYGWSEAAWEHKAFNWFPARKMLALPFADWRPNPRDPWNGFVSDLRLFHVDVDRGISPRGSIRMDDLYVTHASQDWSWTYSPWVRRSVMADDFAYAVSDAGIRVADMRAPSRPVATALFDTLRRE